MENNFLENYEMKGEILEILKYPSPILKKVAEEVTQFDENLKKLVINMLYTMYQSPGIGLAAPQVGASLRLFVIDIWYNREKVELPNNQVKYEYSEFSPLVFINPKFTSKSGEIIHEEGCLSVPGIFENVKRFEKVTVDFQDLKGNFHTMDAEELFAICLQHENDHLDGIVFIERLSLLKKQFLEKKFLKQQNKK